MRPLCVATHAASVSMLSLALAASSLAAAPPAPVARVGTTVDVLDGVSVADPYRYMENIKSTKLQTWLRAQGDATRDALDRLDMRVDFFKQIEEFSSATGIGVGVGIGSVVPVFASARAVCWKAFC